MNDGLDRRQSLRRVCEEHGVALLYVFGSQAERVLQWLERGGDLVLDEGSDVDVGARHLPGVSWSVMEKVRLAQALEDLFSCPRVDLVVLGEADPFLAFAVIQGERLYAADDHEADEYDLYVMRRAGDLAPLERERLDLILGESS